MTTKLLTFLGAFFMASIVYSQEELYSAATIPSELKSNANAVLRLNNLDILIEARDEMKISCTRVVTVLNEKGNRLVGGVVGYDNYRKIKSIEAIIFNEFGDEIKKIKKRDFIDHSAVDGSTLYSDSRLLYMPYTPISYPYTVRLEYEVETPNTLAIYSWRPVEGYFFSVEESNYSVIDNVGLGLRYKEKNFSNFDVVQNNTENSLRYSVKNIQSFKPEDLSPELSQYTPRVMAAIERFRFYGLDGEANNWEEFGAWMRRDLIEGRQEVSVTTKQKVLELTEGVDNPIKKAKLVYQFVQDNTRYISVQVGIGGNQPISAMEVDRLKYGDCKGLTNYTQALLNVVGVESYYTVVEAGRRMVDFEDDFASLQQGNHIILAIPDNEKLVWLDCTSQTLPFGFIGDFTDNRKVLAVKPTGCEIVKTTSYPDEGNLQTTKAKAVLGTDGSLSATVDITSKGIQYEKYQLETGSEKELEEYYKKYWWYINNLDLVSKSFQNDKDAIEFMEHVSLKAINYASVNANRLIFNPNAFSRNGYVPERYRSRKSPFVIQRGYVKDDVCEYSIPEGFEIEAVPEKHEIDNKFGHYSIEIRANGQTLIYKRKLSIKSGNYPKTDYKAYREFRKEVAKQDNAIIVLKPTNK